MSATGENGQRCAAVRKSGEPCAGRPLAGSPYCFAHAPGANANRAKGGRATRKSERAVRYLPDRLRPVSALLAEALEEVHAGDLDPRVASAMAALAGALVRVYTAADFEARLAALESTLAGRGGIA